MAKKKLSEEQNIRIKARQEVVSRREFLNQLNNRAIKDQFIEKFVLCEIAIKTVLRDYHKVRGREIETENIKMGLPTIKAALKHAQYDVRNENLEKIFKAKKRRGERSARDLRNGIVHDLTKPDLQELIKRKNELFRLLDDFTTLLISDIDNNTQ